MANPSKRSVVDKVRRASYATNFEIVYGKEAFTNVQQAYDRIGQAIAAYERSEALMPFSSKYDAWLAGKVKLTEQELRGLKLYQDEKKGNCASCHPSQRGHNGEPPLFTNFTFDNLGVPRHPHNPFYTQAKTFNRVGYDFVDLGLGRILKNKREVGKFKVPTLRNIAITRPYMHNGYFSDLNSLLAFMSNRDIRPRCKSDMTDTEAMRQSCWPKPEVSANVNKVQVGKLGLTALEREAIVAFLHTLTDGYQDTKSIADRR